MEIKVRFDGQPVVTILRDKPFVQDEVFTHEDGVYMVKSIDDDGVVNAEWQGGGKVHPP
jgi:hypothetical protein